MKILTTSHIFVPTPQNPVNIINFADSFGEYIGSAIITALPYAVGLYAAVKAWRYVTNVLRMIL